MQTKLTRGVINCALAFADGDVTLAEHSAPGGAHKPHNNVLKSYISSC